MAREGTPWLSVPAAAALLLWPALWNGYPIVFADSGTYLSQAINRYAGWDRPVFYSVFMLPLHWKLTVWPVVVAQALLTAWVLRAVCALLVPAMAGWAFVVGVAGLALFTWLPWLVSELMPDVFTSLLVLVLGLIWVGRRRSGLVVLAACMIATQQSSVPLAVALGLGLVGLSFSRGWRPLVSHDERETSVSHDERGTSVSHDGQARRSAIRLTLAPWLGVALPPVLAVLALCWVNVLAHGRLSVSPYGNLFLLARVIGDGPGTDVLRRDCPAAGWALCRFVDRLPATADDFLWMRDSPLYLAGGPKAVSAEAGAIIKAALVADPWGEAAAAMGNTLRQLGRFDSGDGLTAWPDQVTPWIRQDFPAPEYARYAAALQQSGRLAVPWPLGLAHKVVALGGVAGCLLLLPRAIRRRSASAVFISAVLIALPAGAAITGALSGPHDRYQSRIMWLPPFIATVSLVAFMRRRA